MRDILPVTKAGDFIIRAKSGLLGAEIGKPSLGWMVGWAEKGIARTVFALNLDCPRAASYRRPHEADAAMPRRYRRDLIRTEELMKSIVWMSSLMVAAASGWLAATMFAQPATSKEPRFPQLTMDRAGAKRKSR